LRHFQANKLPFSVRFKQRDLHFARTFATWQTQNLEFPLRQENNAQRVSNSLFQFTKLSWFRWIELFGPTPQNELSEAILVILGEVSAAMGYDFQPKFEH